MEWYEGTCIREDQYGNCTKITALNDENIYNYNDIVLRHNISKDKIY